MKKKILLLFVLVVLECPLVNAQETVSEIAVKAPGNQSVIYNLNFGENGELSSVHNLPLVISKKITEEGNKTRIEVFLEAKETIYYNYSEKYIINNSKHNDCQFYMPGFWYHRNLRSPKKAPSFHSSDSWRVREDRMSSPLTGIYNEKNDNYYTVARLDDFEEECLVQHASGEVILSGKTSIGYLGFHNEDGLSSLVFGFPYQEAPKSYIRKLTLIPAVKAFEKLKKGESRKLVWEIKKGRAIDYSAFVAEVWNYSYDTFSPKEVKLDYSLDSAKKTLSNFFKESYVDDQDLKYFSGVHLKTESCESTGVAEVGFVGRVLLNAYNALEYGEETNNTDLVNKANSIFNSYLSHSFTKHGFFRELVNYDNNTESTIYSIRRQSEGAFAILNYLKYEKLKGREHPEWEERIKVLLDNFLKLQEDDGHFPRKFDDNFSIKDASGGSTPSATLPLTMAYTYFNNKKYLESAARTAEYLENELISKSDYFSSTLDANCEDKEASLYASTAMYYLSFVSKGKAREHYIDLSMKAAYFSLSWYYLWDVPFAQGQMLGDVGFKSRGWGNVSVENNHIDVFIFEFATILDWLAKERNEPKFSKFSSVIKSSMLQLLPNKGNMFNIGKIGYYPEVVQHTNWDYGKNGKGFYNDIFAPGWTVASLWQMLSPERVSEYFNPKN